MTRQFALFCVSGALAFLVDGGVVQALVSGLDANPYLARGVSFLCAVTFTWQFNRRYTFTPVAGRGLLREWRLYTSTQLGGFAVNYAVYSALVFGLAMVREWPILGVAAGSVAGLMVNFFAARRWVFAGGRSQS